MMGEWIDINDRLPTKRGPYLVTYHPCKLISYRMPSKGVVVNEEITKVGIDTYRGKTCWAKNRNQKVTHWMELPEPAVIE